MHPALRFRRGRRNRPVGGGRQMKLTRPESTGRRAVVAALAALAAWPVHSDDAFPSKPLRLVVPAPPGGLTDTVARLLADGLQPALRQMVVVDNRPGAAGMIGTQAVAEAPADGYTLLITSTSNHVLAPLTQKAARIDPARDLLPIALGLRTVGVLVVPSGVPARTLPELIALARSQPGRLNYASSGVGSANHVFTERFKVLAGIDMVHVPFRGGAPLMSAVMSSEVQFALMDYATVEPALRVGRARVLAQTGTHRHVALPDVPTLAEAGFKDYDPSFWIGLAAPKATPAAVVSMLNAAVNRALAQTAFKARAQAQGWTLVGGAPSVLADTVAREIAAYRDTVSGLNLDRQ
jgi:tripartite-type tricarboxylate transporter receptor subunit TctC